MVNVGDTIRIGKGTVWEQDCRVLEVCKRFKNGNTAVVVDLQINGGTKRKVFHV